MKYDKKTLLDLFQIGSQAEFAFDAKTNGKAINLRQILYYYRTKMKKENDPFFAIANSVLIRVCNSYLIVSPIGNTELQSAINLFNKRKPKK